MEHMLNPFGIADFRAQLCTAPVTSPDPGSDLFFAGTLDMTCKAGQAVPPALIVEDDDAARDPSSNSRKLFQVCSRTYHCDRAVFSFLSDTSSFVWAHPTPCDKAIDVIE